MDFWLWCNSPAPNAGRCCRCWQRGGSAHDSRAWKEWSARRKVRILREGRQLHEPPADITAASYPGLAGAGWCPPPVGSNPPGICSSAARSGPGPEHHSLSTCSGFACSGRGDGGGKRRSSRADSPNSMSSSTTRTSRAITITTPPQEASDHGWRQAGHLHCASERATPHFATKGPRAARRFGVRAPRRHSQQTRPATVP